MERSRVGLGLGLTGAIVFLISIFILLPLSGIYYLPSLFGMFAGVVLIAIGIAISKGVDQSLEHPTDDCYYCKGTGKVDRENCPRCGGTGISPPEA
ncbi:MAG: hypothetical protein BV458_09230 [Thermoplasmata archaeon M9B2D]|nr:MAG: hypothetical protein BV458_09230 [Thermoplasmata archaeon M9B2D]